MKRAFTSILVADPERSARFYEQLLGMNRHGDFGWFVILTHEEMPGLEFGLLDRDHETVPEALAKAAGGALLTFVVNDVLDSHARAQGMKAHIIEAPIDMPYGQRRMLVRDPDGFVLDISSPTPA